jgi:hypothetical protein
VHLIAMEPPLAIVQTLDDQGCDFRHSQI